MKLVEMLLNYLDFYKITVLLIAILIICVTFLLISLDLSNLSDKIPVNNNITIKSFEKEKKIVLNDKIINKEIVKKNSPKLNVKAFYLNKFSEIENKFMLNEETENISLFTKNFIITKNNIKNKNDEISKMFIESLSSLNSWKNNDIENKIFEELNWNIEKKLEEEEESIIFQYIFPKYKDYNNFSPSQSSLNSFSETEDGEEEKEKLILSKYKLGICRIFDCCEEIKSNIVKEVNGSLYKIYSKGNPYLIKEKCKKETIPQNFITIIEKYNKEGYNIIGISGKKIKMNYIQSQKIERNKCESNMLFLGFIIYKVNYDEYKSAYS